MRLRIGLPPGVDFTDIWRHSPEYIPENRQIAGKFM